MSAVQRQALLFLSLLGLVSSFLINPAARSAGKPAWAAASRLQAVKDVSSAEQFDGIVQSAEKGQLVVVDYSTTWCGPCKIMAPKFDDMSNRYSQAIFIKVVGDSTPEASKLMKREGVRAVPAFHFWKDAKKVDTISGADPEKLESTIVHNI